MKKFYLGFGLCLLIFVWIGASFTPTRTLDGRYLFDSVAGKDSVVSDIVTGDRVNALELLGIPRVATKVDTDCDSDDEEGRLVWDSTIDALFACEKSSGGVFSWERVGLTEFGASAITSGTLSNERLDTDLQDLADGSLSGNKIGTGINANNINSGTLHHDRLDDQASIKDEDETVSGDRNFDGRIRIQRSATEDCNNSIHEGSLRYNTTNNSLEVCNNDGGQPFNWAPISYDGDRDGFGRRNSAGTTIDENDADANVSDSDLIAANVKDGINIFGVSGTLAYYDTTHVGTPGQHRCATTLVAMWECRSRGHHGYYSYTASGSSNYFCYRLRAYSTSTSNEEDTTIIINFSDLAYSSQRTYSRRIENLICYDIVPDPSPSFN